MKKNTGKIYLLINTEVNKERSVRDSLKMIESVILADMVTGRYDIIAVVEGDAVEHLFTTVMDKIRQIDGIVRTETNVAIEQAARACLSLYSTEIINHEGTFLVLQDRGIYDCSTVYATPGIENE